MHRQTVGGVGPSDTRPSRAKRSSLSRHFLPAQQVDPEGPHAYLNDRRGGTCSSPRAMLQQARRALPCQPAIQSLARSRSRSLSAAEFASRTIGHLRGDQHEGSAMSYADAMARYAELLLVQRKPSPTAHLRLDYSETRRMRSDSETFDGQALWQLAEFDHSVRFHNFLVARQAVATCSGDARSVWPTGITVTQAGDVTVEISRGLQVDPDNELGRPVILCWRQRSQGRNSAESRCKAHASAPSRLGHQPGRTRRHGAAAPYLHRLNREKRT